MDLALVLNKLLPAAEYFGSCTDNSEEAYNKLTWNDERSKPTWEELVIEWASMEPDLGKEEEQETLIQDKIRELAVTSLKAEGKLPVDFTDLKVKSK